MANPSIAAVAPFSLTDSSGVQVDFPGERADQNR